MTTEIIKARVILMQNTLSVWTSLNPIIPQGELVLEIGSPMQAKIGDGLSNYLSLPYLVGGGSSPGDGTYLGIAVLATNPGTPASNSWYYCQTVGIYTHFPVSTIVTVAPATMPAGATLGILSFNTTSSLWSYRTLVGPTSSVVPTLEAVLLAGSQTDQQMVFEDSITSPTLGMSLSYGGVNIYSVLSGGVANLFNINKLGFQFIQTIASVAKQIVFGFTQLTSNRSVIFQDRSGTIATVEPRIETSASYTTSHVINTDLFDWSFITALAGNLLISNPTITPQSGETGYGRTFCISITDNGTPRALTYGANIVGDMAGLTLPTTTVSSKKLVMEFSYLDDTKFHLMGITQQS